MSLVSFIFFFKQKTAYEMRSSDWSSDVCSSDLDHDRDAGAERRGGPCAAGRGDDHMTPILFIDRDGTLIEEPADYQIDACDKLRFVAGVIPALMRLRDAGYQFVIVSNQDGLGTERFPRAAFDGPRPLLLQVFERQGGELRDVRRDDTIAE